MKQLLLNVAKRFMFENPGKRAGLAELTRKLEQSKVTLLTRFAAAEGGEANRKKLRHIIAIERWGQRRLKVALGEPFVKDENYAYKPDRETSWQTLQTQFAATRDETIQLAWQLGGADPSQSVIHNDFGELSLTGWLAYLHSHANFEAKRVKPA